MNNEGSVVISKMFKFEKRSQYKSQYFRPPAFLQENMTIAGKYDNRHLQSKERINV